MEGSAPNFNQPSSLYSYPNQNPNYIPPENTQGYNSQGNNIYSGYSPQMGGNIYSQASGNIYSQPYNSQPLTNPPIYAPQVSGNINPGYAPQTSGDINQDMCLKLVVKLLFLL